MPDAPATTPAPAAAAPAAAPPADKAPADFMAAEMADFAAMDQAPPPAPAKAPVRGTPPKGEDGKFVKRETKSPVTPAKKPEEGQTPPEEGAAKPDDTQTPPEAPGAKTPMGALRERYDGLSKKVKEELQPEIQRLKAKLEQYEGNGGEPVDPVQTQARIKTLEERNKELEQRIALVDYEASQEFSTKYDQPYRQMWQRAVSAFSQLTVKEPAGEDDMGNPTFNARAATEADLIKLGAMPLSELDEAAANLFGASAPRAVQYIERLRDLAESRQTALTEAKTRAGEWKNQQELQSKALQKSRATAWDEVNKGLAQKFPKAYNPEDGDVEDKAAHEKGFALADLVFLGHGSLTPEQIETLPASFKETMKAGKPLNEMQKVQLHALARLKIANHERLLAGRKKDKARIAELEKALAEYEKSEPGGRPSVPREGGAAGDWLETASAELKAMDKG